MIDIGFQNPTQENPMICVGFYNPMPIVGSFLRRVLKPYAPEPYAGENPKPIIGFFAQGFKTLREKPHDWHRVFKPYANRKVFSRRVLQCYANHRVFFA